MFYFTGYILAFVKYWKTFLRKIFWTVPTIVGRRRGKFWSLRNCWLAFSIGSFNIKYNIWTKTNKFKLYNFQWRLTTSETIENSGKNLGLLTLIILNWDLNFHLFACHHTDQSSTRIREIRNYSIASNLKKIK